MWAFIAWLHWWDGAGTPAPTVVAKHPKYTARQPSRTATASQPTRAYTIIH